MGFCKKLVEWIQRPGRSGFGIVIKSIGTGIIILLLVAMVVWLFPSQRHNIRVIAAVPVGLGVGFVYGCNGGPAVWLFGFAIVFPIISWDSSQSAVRNLVYIALYVALFYVGFGLSRLAKCRVGM